MTLLIRILVPAAEVSAWQAAGYREVFRMSGGMRQPAGESVVMEWRAPAEET